MDAYDLSTELFDLNKRKNDGAGIAIIVLLIEELRVGNTNEARRIADWNWSQLKEESDIAELLEKELFMGKI